MFTRLQMERFQVLVYLMAITIGALFGWGAPAAAPLMETLLWPVLACLLFLK